MKPISGKFVFDILKYYAAKDANGTEEKWYVEGYAVTTDPDYAGDQISKEAIKAAAKDFTKNSTVLRNHNLDEEIGTVVKTKVDEKGLFVKVLISKTVPNIWTKITEKVLNKFSVRMKITEAVKTYSKSLKRILNVVKRMELVELSIVSVAMNSNAKVTSHYVSKMIREYEDEGNSVEVDIKDEHKKDVAKILFGSLVDRSKKLGIDITDAVKLYSKNKDNDAGGSGSDALTEDTVNTIIENKLKNFEVSDILISKIKEFDIFNELSTKINTAMDTLTGIEQKLILYEDYPKLKEELVELRQLFENLGSRVGSVEKNVGIIDTSDDTNKDDPKKWSNVFPTIMQ